MIASGVGRTLAIFLLMAAAQARTAGGTRNVLIVHTDEHNYRTLGCYRALMPPPQARMWGPEFEVPTPSTDRLAREGVLCTRMYAAMPVCSPSRASFLTGRPPHQTGVPRNDLPMRDDAVTFAEILRRQGWRTAYLGKWHLDGEAKPGWAPKRKFGFEDNRYMYNRGHWKVLEDGPEGPRVKTRNRSGEPTASLEGADERSFTTDFLTDRALEILSKDRARPFCVMVSYPDPHGPNTVRAPYDTMFDPSVIRPPPSWDPPEPTPRWAPPVAGRRWSGEAMARYGGMVKCVDDNIGRVLAQLERDGRLDDTLVVFTSDHGDLCGEHGRHNKGVPFETAAGVPFVLRAPGLLPAGAVVTQALTTTDFAPTLLGLLGLPAEPSPNGRDASALLRSGGREPPGWRRVVYLRGSSGTPDETPVWIAATDGRWKLVLSVSDGPWLFDRVSEPDELRNLVNVPGAAEVLRALGRALIELGEAAADPALRDTTLRADAEWAANGGQGPMPPRPVHSVRDGRRVRAAHDNDDDERD